MNGFTILIWIWIGVAILTFVSLVFTGIRAPYGRHSNNRWGKTIDNHWGWFWMELPALLIFPILAILGPNEKTILSWLLISLWLFHYVYRTLIFPFKIKTKGKRMPLVIVFSALFFNGVNGFINGYFLGFVAGQDPGYFHWNVGIGLILFFTGMFINRIADRKLIALRQNQKGYQIPRRWLFEYISCPNHFGEIIEWMGFALVAWSLPALSFAIWTFCNLVPRALNHHNWYHENFKDYPQERKAVFPYLW